MSDAFDFAAETARFDKFDEAFNFLTEMYGKETMDSPESLTRCRHLNAAREALAQEMRESVAKLRKLKEEREAYLDNYLDAHFSDEYSKVIPF